MELPSYEERRGALFIGRLGRVSFHRFTQQVEQGPLPLKACCTHCSSLSASKQHLRNWRHRPNRDCAKWLIEKVWPAVRQRLPKLKLSVYGANQTPEDAALTQENVGAYAMTSETWLPRAADLRLLLLICSLIWFALTCIDFIVRCDIGSRVSSYQHEKLFPLVAANASWLRGRPNILLCWGSTSAPVGLLGRLSIMLCRCWYDATLATFSMHEVRGYCRSVEKARTGDMRGISFVQLSTASASLACKIESNCSSCVGRLKE